MLNRRASGDGGASWFEAHGLTIEEVAQHVARTMMGSDMDELEVIVDGDNEPQRRLMVRRKVVFEVENLRQGADDHPKLKLEVGKRYVLRNGKRTPPLLCSTDSKYPFCAHVDGAYMTWTIAGWANYRVAGQPQDIVSEYVEPEPPKLKLELGKRYVLRNGDVTGLLHISTDITYPYWANVPDGYGARESWTVDGWADCRAPGQPQDIVSEYVEPPKQWRPFRPHELFALLKQAVVNTDGDAFEITGVSRGSVLVGNTWVGADELLAGFVFVDGGQRCGVLE